MKTLTRAAIVLVALLSLTVLNACASAATTIPPTAPAPTIAPTDTPLPSPTPPLVFKQLPLPKPIIRENVDVNGHKMWLECYGKGSPTIILENGYGVTSSTWYIIIPQLAAETQVCAYDRINTGNSTFLFDQTRTMAQANDELRALLQAVDIEGPYVLAGHSLGGFFVLTYASHYPQEVAGAVLVDSAYLDFCPEILKAMPAPSPDESRALSDLRDGCKDDSWVLEEINMEPEVRAVKSLDSIPLVVLSSGPESKNTLAMWAGLPSDLVAKIAQAWQDGHKEYTRLSTNSTHIVAEKSGHFIQNDEPQLVIDAILDTVKAVRK